MVVNYEDKKLTQRYQLMAQTIIPRPIGWILTQNDEGVLNVAPFSYFMGLSSEPATMVVSIGHKSDGTPKDTLKNIRNNKLCTICMVDESSMQKMHFSSKEIPSHESEAVMFEIETQQIMDGFPPIIKDTPSAFFCTLYQEIDLANSKTIPLIVEIQYQYIDEKIIKNKEKLVLEYDPLLRVGKSYATLGEKITPPQIP